MAAIRTSPVPGLTLIDPLHLPPEFRKFKNDDLFYISTCVFYPTAKPGEKEPKPIHRVLAVTPAAIFVTDTFGAMDRATRVEMIESVYFEHLITKKFFGSEEAMHVAVKIPKECDIHVSFDKNATDKEDPFRALSDLRAILAVLVPYRSSGRQLSITDVKTQNKTLKEVMNEKPPAGFLSPKEIIAANAARQASIDKLESIMNESTQLQQAITNLEKLVAKKSSDLAQLETTAGSDLTQLRRQRDSLVEKNKLLHREHNTAEIELVKLQTDVAALQQQLKEEQEQREQLIQQEASGFSKGGDDKQKETDALRKRAQFKEMERETEKLNRLKSAVAVPCRYDGPSNLVARAQGLEADIQKECDRLERDWEASIKIERFLDQTVAELKELTDQIQELHAKKVDLLTARATAAAAREAAAERKSAPVVAVAPAPAAVGGFDDDDLLGGGPPPAKAAPAPAAAAGGGLDDDDDLLGGGPSAPAAAAPSTTAAGGGGGGGFDDDDLLGGGPAAAPPAAAPAGGGDDLF